MSEDTVSVMLAAGGTGGHMFPAYALAEELARRGVTVDLVTDMRGDRYGKGFPARATYRVPSATLTSRQPWAVARTGFTLLSGLRAAHKLLGEVRPRAVIGFGGYPTVPPLAAAYLRRIPTAIHEQNAVLGRANRMLARRVTAVATSFDRVELLDGVALSKVRCTGNPVRAAVLQWGRGPYRPPEPGGSLVLLVVGGSQGARFFSDTVPAALKRLAPEVRAKVKVVQQCRVEDLDRVRSAYEQLGIAADLATFFDNLPERMAGAHLVLGRAGASSVAELAAVGRPSILVPLPHAVDNDQLHNATKLADAGGAWCIEQRDLT
ncbi:MAG: undecaprenyldiphospho-muramoylpentapeptide beta-N-acetylglucosaminyltransferase, partial [Hyphomicrobiaceae bacterium]